MHDIKAIRDDPAGFDAAMARRALPASADELLENDAALRKLLTEQQLLQGRRNELTKRIGILKRQGEDTSHAQAEAVRLNADLGDFPALIAERERTLRHLLESLPNILDDKVPDGLDEGSNVEGKRFIHGPHPFSEEGLSSARDLVRSVGLPLARQHFELGELLGLMDFESAARIAGARFTILRGGLARLERALGQFMIDLHVTEHGYEEVAVPGLVNETAMTGTGQLPKFADDSFKTTDGRWLIPTAEVPLTNIVAGQIIPHARLPIRMTALTDCYRSEAGSAGRDTRGMLRQHQFRKVELVSIVAPEDSDAEHERMTRCAETVLERLNLPYRRMLLCAGDTGFSAAKTYDLEVWLFGQQRWREISSCSNCRDFQARRMNARMRDANGKTIRPLHTLNGSGVAVGRALVAVMERYQDVADGSIKIPEALRPYMGGLDSLRPP